ncbi:MAG: hypothetical protein RI995_711 [Bacteroidota bacterium]|jgi:hypothetical protein
MYSKLTLSINSEIIEEAKDYAKAQNMSLSKLIENYLITVTKNQTKSIKITPLVESLSGIASGNTNNFRADYTDHLLKKYS